MPADRIVGTCPDSSPSNPDTFSPQNHAHTANKLIAWLTGLLTLTLAFFAFVLSFNALADLAAAHGVSLPALFPLIVEAAVVIFSLNALQRSLSGEKARVQWTFIIGASLLAGTFNVLHASDDPVSKIIAAMPSLFLLLSFETFLGQVKHAVKRSNRVKSLAQLEAELNAKRSQLRQELNARRSEIEQLNRQAEQLKTRIGNLEEKENVLRSGMALLQTDQRTAEPFNLVESNPGASQLAGANRARASNKDQALRALLAFYRSNPNATLKEAGAAIGRSKSTVSNYLDELETTGRIHRNGQGIKVIG